MSARVTSARIPDQLPEPTLRRLPWYLAFVQMLKGRKVEYISTTRIAEELDVDPSQIAKDLSFLGIRGKTRIGYQVEALEAKLRDYLGFDRRHCAIMAGAGSLGAALIADSGLQRYGLNIVAGVDINPDIVGTEISGVHIYAQSEVPELVKKLGVKIGIIAVPVEAAQEVADYLSAAGVQAIWNFTPSRIRVPEGVVISNTSIYSHLAVMYNRLSSLDE
ncbi:MAG: redox-sensing transcriptional repressor Rex [Bacteroidales bacterium]|nr:redox-sensing transcriptional repressor Rex [Bacteroidales bacterium]MBD5219282.1 redox-sensing transcriptional repressor Rex [Bacteroidales bacterium]MDE6436044.1 redox-sensing transcriptional repressor Rex [Muribaculaceae bacterium]